MQNYSYSKINIYKQCAKKYEFRYVHKVKLESSIMGVEAFLGDVLHHVLEAMYKPLVIYEEKKVVNNSSQPTLFLNIDDVIAAQSEKKKTDIKNSLKLSQILEIYDARWKYELTKCKKEDIELKFPENKDINDFYQIGKECIIRYYKKFQPFRRDQTLGVEIEVEMDLEKNGKYVLVGVIDRLSRVKKGVYNIVDYKAFTKLPSLQKIKDMTKQLEIYEFAIRELYPDAIEINLIWYIVTHDEEIRITKNLRNSIDQKYLEKLKSKIIENIKEIQESTQLDIFTPKVTKLCDWCEYKQICPAWK